MNQHSGNHALVINSTYFGIGMSRKISLDFDGDRSARQLLELAVRLDDGIEITGLHLQQVSYRRALVDDFAHENPPARHRASLLRNLLQVNVFVR